MGNVDYILGTLIMLPLILLIHECGHAFFAKLFGGKVTDITIGYGKLIYSKGILNIKSWYFVYGHCFWKDLKTNSKISKILIILGGIIFNVLSMAFVFIPYLILYPKYNIDDTVVFATIFHTFLEYSFSFVVFNLIPFRIPIFRMDNDGLQLYKLIKYGYSNTFIDE